MYPFSFNQRKSVVSFSLAVVPEAWGEGDEWVRALGTLSQPTLTVHTLLGEKAVAPAALLVDPTKRKLFLSKPGGGTAFGPS